MTPDQHGRPARRAACPPRVSMRSTSDTEVMAALMRPARLRRPGRRGRRRDGPDRGCVCRGGHERARAGRVPRPGRIRPLVVGRLSDAWVLASETCAFDLIGARTERELEPGEMVVVDRRARPRLSPRRQPPRLAVRLRVHLLRPARLGHGRPRPARGAAGHGRAPRRGGAGRGRRRDRRARLRDAGRGRRATKRSGIPFGEGLVKTRYVGRTSSSPTRPCASAASSSSSTRCGRCSRAAGWWSSTTPPSCAARRPASS